MLRIALGQFNVVVGDLASNAERMREIYARAVRSDVDLLVFPELAVCGYPPEDLVYKKAFLEDNRKTVDKLAGFAFHTAETGSPLLDDCASAFDCKVIAVYDLDREKLLVGQIVHAERIRDEYEPLVYFTISIT